MRVAGVQDIERACQAVGSIVAEHVVAADDGLHGDAVADSVAFELLAAIQDVVDMYLPSVPELDDLPPLSPGEEIAVERFLANFDRGVES